MADDIAALIDHLGLEKPDVVGYSLGGGVAFFTAVEAPGEGRQARHGLGQHSARRDPGRDAGPAGPGQRGGGGVHEGHADVRALPAASPRARRTSRGCSTRWANRWRRTSTSARSSAASQVPTLHRGRRCRHGAAEPLRRGVQAARRRPPRRRLDGRGPAQGRPRARDPARRSRTTTSPSRRCSPRSSSTSSTASRPGLDMRDLGSRDDTD